MKREVYVFSTLNGASAEPQSFFRKIFEVENSSVLPKVDLEVSIKSFVKNCTGQGVITDAKFTGTIQQVSVGAEMSTQDLRNCLVSAEGWEEVFDKPE